MPLHRTVLRSGQNTWLARTSQTTGQANASTSPAHRSEHLAGSRQSDYRAGQCIVQPSPGAGKTVLLAQHMERFRAYLHRMLMDVSLRHHGPPDT